jgi:hypothetical protein
MSSLKDKIEKMQEVPEYRFFQFLNGKGLDAYNLVCPITLAPYILYETVDCIPKGVVSAGKYYIPASASLPDAQKVNYIQGKGVVCPFCGTLEGINRRAAEEVSDLPDGELMVRAQCQSCGQLWNEMYSLKRILED